MKLELKHLAPYLPYGLKIMMESIVDSKEPNIEVLTGIQYDGLALLGEGGRFGFYQRSFEDIKPILRPLSDLTKEIEVDGEKFVPLIRLTEMGNILLPDKFDRLYCKTYPNDKDYIECYERTASPDDHLCIGIYFKEIVKSEYWLVQQLFQWHFDVFGLIDEGLAIDVNTL